MLARLVFALPLVLLLPLPAHADPEACRSADPDTAIRGCTAMIDQKRAQPAEISQAHVLRGRAYGRKGDLKRAIAEIDEGLRVNPKNAVAYLNRAIAQERAGDVRQALADAETAQRLDPKMEGLVTLLPRLKSKLAAATPAPTPQPGPPAPGSAAVPAAPALPTAKSPAASPSPGPGQVAAKQPTQPVAAVPAQPIAASALPRECAAGTPADRIAACTRVISGGPADKKLLAAAHRSRGHAHGRAASETALADFAEAIRLDPDDALNFFLRAQHYAETGQPDKAVADLETAIGLAKTGASVPVLRLMRGQQLLVLRRADEALMEIEQALVLFRASSDERLKRQIPPVLTARCAALGQLGQHDKALGDCGEAIKLQPDLPAAHAALGQVQERAGNRDRALASYRRAAQLFEAARLADTPDARNVAAAVQRLKAGK